MLASLRFAQATAVYTSAVRRGMVHVAATSGMTTRVGINNIRALPLTCSIEKNAFSTKAKGTKLKRANHDFSDSEDEDDDHPPAKKQPAAKPAASAKGKPAPSGGSAKKSVDSTKKGKPSKKN